MWNAHFIKKSNLLFIPQKIFSDADAISFSISVVPFCLFLVHILSNIPQSPILAPRRGAGVTTTWVSPKHDRIHTLANSNKPGRRSNAFVNLAGRYKPL